MAEEDPEASASGDWWYNSLRGSEVTRTFLICNWTCIALGCFIIMHSYYVNRRKYHKIRLLAETCAFGGITASMCNLIYATSPEDVRYSAMFPNFLGAGIFNIPLQLPDNLLFLYAYIALSTAGRARKYMRPWEAIVTALYIILVLFLPFIAPVTFIPLIVNENTDDYNTKVGLPLIQGYVFGYLAWNCYFTVIFAVTLYRCYFDKRKLYPSLSKEICIKCIVHFVISSFAILQFYILGIQQLEPQAGPVYTLSIMASLHFIFNTKRYRRMRIKSTPIVPAPPNRVQIIIGAGGKNNHP